MLRTKAEGGTVFTVCDACWDKHYKPAVALQRFTAEDLELQANLSERKQRPLTAAMLRYAASILRDAALTEARMTP